MQAPPGSEAGTTRQERNTEGANPWRGGRRPIPAVLPVAREFPGLHMSPQGGGVASARRRRTVAEIHRDELHLPCPLRPDAGGLRIFRPFLQVLLVAGDPGPGTRIPGHWRAIDPRLGPAQE